MGRKKSIFIPILFLFLLSVIFTSFSIPSAYAAVPTVEATQTHLVISNAETSGIINFSLGSLSENDIILIHVALDGSVTNLAAAGYTSFASHNDGSSVDGYWLWKRMGGTPDTSVTITWTGSEQARITLLRISGAINTGDIIDTTGAVSSGTGTSVTPTSPASTVANTLFIASVTVDRDRVDDLDSVSGTGWTKISTSGSSDVGAHAVGSIIATLNQEFIGTPADPTFDSWASDGYAAIVFNIKELDTTSPTPTITSSDGASGSTTNANPINFSISFDESVTGFTSGDVSVSGTGSPGAVTGFTGSGAGPYTFTIAPGSDGTVIVDVNSSVATDLAGNNNVAATQFTITSDTTGPTPTITSSDGASGSTTNANPINFSISFDESVTGFTSGDVSVSGTGSPGAVTGFTGSGAGPYTFTIAPGSDGTVIVDVNGSVATDLAGNNNVAATQFTITSDTTGPTVTITSSTGSDGDTVNNTTLNYTATFSESVSDFVIGDITVSGTANGGSPAATNFAGSGTTYTFDVLRGSSDGTVAVTINAGVATDTYGNTNSISNTYDFTIDTTSPTPTITSSDGASGSTTNANPINFSISFDESVTGFTSGDVSVSGTGSPGAVTGFTGSGAGPYTFTIAPGSDGTVIVDVNSSVATDLAGNNNVAATQFTITSDTTGPTPTITSSDGASGSTTNANPINFSISFDESVTGFTSGDVSVSGTGSPGAVTGFTGSGAGPYTFTIAPGSDGTVIVDVNSSVATDLAGNNNVAATQFTITSDTTGPTVTITSSTGSDGATIADNTINYTATFSESVSDFVIGDITVSGTANGGSPAATNFAGSGTTYTFDVLRGSSDGTVAVTINAGIATDTYGNANSISNTYDFTIDQTRPTVTITSSTGSDGDTVNNTTLSYTATFSESVSDFVIGDITVSGTANGGSPAATNFAGSGTTYTFDVLRGSSDGTVIVNIAENVATDALSRTNHASNTYDLTIDTTGPTVTITSSTGSDGDTVNNTTLSYTATFSESVSDFVIGDITVSGTANGGSPAATNFAGSGTTYTFDVLRGSSDGTVAVTINAGVATDTYGNTNSISNTYDLTIDTTGPTVTITSSTGSDGDTVNNTTLSYTATFSESVSDFVIGDITVSGTANGGSPAATNFAGSGTTYTFDVLRGSSDGTVAVTINAGVATDALSRTNQASNIYDLTIDTVAPTFTADRTGGDTIILTFSENVETTIIDGSGYTVTSGSVSANSNPSGSLTMTLTTSGITETDATPTITYNQTSGNTIDSVGNEVEHNQSTLATDSVSPTFVSAQTTIANRIDVTFSEAMAATGATPGDFVVGGTLSNTRIVVSITVSGDDLQLELDGDLSESDSPTISFTNSGIRPTDTATSPNDLENFGPESFLIDLSTAPTSPQNLFATVVNYESISLSWNAPLDDGGSSILGYKIERESPRGDGWAVLVSDTGNTETDYTDFGLSENTEYNYRISAINSIGTSTPSDSSFAKTLQIYRSSSDDKSFPPEFLGIGFYKFNFISDEQIKSDHYENPTESFGDYFPYSKYSDVLDKKRYENTGNYEKNGQYFLVDNYLKDIATFSADIDQPVQIQIRLLQERQTLEIHHLAIYLDIQDNSGKDALTYIIVDKDKPVKIVDPEGYIDDIVLNTSLEGTDFYYILDLTFKKAMNETDLFVEVWNENRDVSYLQMYDAFEIIDPALVEEKIEEIPSLVEVKITHDASSPICKSTNSCYTPKVANILEGGFVIWENQDSFLHTVTSGIPKTGADGKFNEIITPGNSFRYQFDTKGIYNYFCVIHPWASGIIKVYDQDGDLGTIQKTVEDLTIKSQRHGSSVIIENQDVLIAERVLKFDVSGSLQDDLGRNAVTITITDPNGKKSIVRGSTNDDGYFTVPIIIYEWQAWRYSVSVNSKDTQIGSISFFAIQRYDY